MCEEWVIGERVTRFKTGGNAESRSVKGGVKGQQWLVGNLNGSANGSGDARVMKVVGCEVV